MMRQGGTKNAVSENLHRVIEQLTVERDFLARKLNQWVCKNAIWWLSPISLWGFSVGVRYWICCDRSIEIFAKVLLWILIHCLYWFFPGNRVLQRPPIISDIEFKSEGMAKAATITIFLSSDCGAPSLYSSIRQLKGGAKKSNSLV